MKKKEKHHYQYKKQNHRNKTQQKQHKIIEMPKSPKRDTDSNEENEEEEENNEFTIKLSMIYFEQCDPKKCTGKKLQKLGLLSETKFYSSYPGILLTPTGKKIVSSEDASIIAENGICVLDCSWAKFNELKLPLALAYSIA